ncbi:hypothetical protein A2526_02885 [candidate division WOR-1 bacterium RIFOXYD2_FULL_36_8]|nr:MAG: hypothetical protein A2526_02885 [candidate division WOR-1 bacterium RIFOXYD2_FULL_36_8]
MSIIEEILKSKVKPKEKVTLLAKKLEGSKKLITDLIAYFKTASTAEKGASIEAIEYITAKNPKFAGSCLDFIVAQINGDEPRVKWEACRIIANISKEFPDETANAIPRLIINTKDDGTVVRWSAASALTKIAINNPKTQKKLLPIFLELVKKETNSGVKNIYIKALKILEK